jgi:hypothetical protein
VRGNHDGPSMIRRFPVPGDVAFTRPVPPYPREYRYGGRGDPAKAESFRSVEPGPTRR